MIGKGLFSGRLMHYAIGIVISLMLVSCGTMSNIQDISQSPEYKIRQLHMEKVNSSYSNLIEDYNESMKSRDVKEAEAFARDTLAHLYITPCFNKCPSFTITVQNSGKAIYTGLQNMEMMGVFESKMSEEQMAQLKSYMSKVQLVRLPSRFPANVELKADLSVAKLVLAEDKLKYDMVINYGEPEDLTKIKLYLEQLVSTLDWVQI